MKRTLQTSTLSTLTAVLIITFAGCRPTGTGANREPVENANARKEAVVDTAAIEKELLDLERQWASAAVTHNADIVKRVEADDIIVTYIDGSTATKADDVRDIETGALTADGWDLADTKVKVLDADAAVVTGRGIIKNGKYKGPDGRIQVLKPDYRFTDVWARRNGQWHAVASQTTQLLNPPPSPSPTAVLSPAPTAVGSPSPRPK